ncbi:MAG: apolipoprotein N-acyltransferase [Candidatus Obscuribacterales bacterium]|nr:apolipoprotein N-acyltransferase [Candidatus Obscuribacterales bacterium]
MSATCGVVLGLSAPGYDQWYLAWCGLAPFFLLAVSSPTWKDCWLRSFIFGTTYNLIYMSWLLFLHPLNWMGLNDLQSMGLAALSWLIAAVHQGLIISGIGMAARFIPMTGGFLPTQVEGKWRLPAFIVLPLLWVLIEEKIGNAHDFLGVPWSMIEYSQYQQTALIQIASLIGGIGVGLFIVMFNVALASTIASATKKLTFKSLAAPSFLHSFANLSVTALLIASALIFGLYRLQTAKFTGDIPLSILQGNINIEMQKTNHRYTLNELVAHYQKLLQKCPSGICVWTESALPAYLKESPKISANLKLMAHNKKLDMIVGSMDKEEDGQPYNSAFGIDQDGILCPEVYHKRYLVPAGEYTPAFVRYLPDFIQRLTDTPAGTGFSAGTKPVVLNLQGRLIAPLICFETISPELVAASVRNGGQLLVNISDLAWFHDSIIGEQTSAAAVFRAIESERYFIYAANTGPSLIINPLGVIEQRTEKGEELLTTGQVKLVSSRTLFTHWFH